MWYDSVFLFPLSKCGNKKKMSEWSDDLIRLNIFNKLLNIAMSRYRFDGLPDTVNQRVVLQSLIVYGSVVFFERDGNILALPGVPSGKGWNVYKDPVSSWIFSANGLENKEIGLYVPGGISDEFLYKGTLGQVEGDRRGCILFENYERYPILNHIIEKTDEIADAMITIDIDRIWLKMPALPVAEESLRESVEQAFKDIQNNRRIKVIGTGLGKFDNVELQPTGNVPQNIEAAISLVDWYEQQFRAICGMSSNAQIDKKGENLITDEININQDFTDQIMSNMIECMTEGLKSINGYLNTNITVRPLKENASRETPEGEEENGENQTEDVSGMD